MKKIPQLTAGFTVVELLVAIVVAVLILAGGSQLYSLALTNSGTAQRRANASNIAYDLLRQAQATVATPCVASGPTAVTIDDPTIITGATAQKTITCPYASSNPNLSLISITVTYNNPETRSVTRAIVAGV